MRASSRDSSPSARLIALRTLRSIEQRKGFSNRILDEQLERSPELAQRERGLATMLVYGVLRHQQRIDAHIDRSARQPRKIKGELRVALRIACFELLELERPLPIASAEAAKTLRNIDPRGNLRPLVAALLKSIDARWRDDEAALRTPLDLLQYRDSLPRWLAERWLAQLGEQKALARARACSEIPWLDVRVANDRSTREEIISQLQSIHPQIQFDLPEDEKACIRVRGAGDIFFGPLYEAGLITIQGRGSQQAALALAVSPGEQVLDACCGMGTKTVQLANALRGSGLLVAADQNAERLRHVTTQLERSAEALESLDVHVVNCDLLDPYALDVITQSPFDAILLDAPCSGLGNLGRHPELRLTRSASDIEDRVSLQQKLLQSCVARLRDGGRLVYCVCSLEHEESHGLIQWALRQKFGTRTLQLEHEAAWTPEEHACDGFYLARLRVSASEC